MKSNLLSNILRIAGSFIFLMLVFNHLVLAETGWPKVIKVAKGEITVYQPQPETLDGNELSGRAAVSVKHVDSNDLLLEQYG